MAETTATKKDSEPEANYKETVESILVAFILAFIFRAFVVEAFVIPTGSMAPTLYGAHMRLTCPDCGYTFDVGYQSPQSANDDDDIDMPDDLAQRPPNIRCPNCAYTFPTQDAQGRPIGQPLRFGDRILVLKYLFLVQNPQRWDVVVFKSPDEKHHVPEDPEYGQNYIKRLIGTPGESICILDGDIYKGNFKASTSKDFHIERKPKFVQDRLWRLVYNNDFIPQGPATSRPDAWHEPWQISDGTGWSLQRNGKPSRDFNFNNANGSSTLFFNDTANRGVFPLTDWISYDQITGTEKEQQHSTPGSDSDITRDGPSVSDLKFSCFYTRKSGDGAMRMYLTKLDHCFVAEFKPGKISLFEAKINASSNGATGKGLDLGPLTLKESADLPKSAGAAPLQIDFMNYDYDVILRVDGKVIFDKPYEPDVKTLWDQAISRKPDPMARPEIRITSERQACSIEHLSLWHDIYYGNFNYHVTFWASPEKLMHLNAGEYFVLGDNSLISGDARYWNQPILLPREGLPDTQGGRVPASFMLGKAFFVYWPAGYRPPFIPKGIIPDFGEMRFIH
ncbi:MAG TPA: S26 family signal peptidase [Tepidisphaeraceae bacterium]|jgi:signal peptidase I|nr:S26 family signal peptidase [Tepidisphaeraceae bacterium]